jgi:hypothetical protein
MDVTSSQVQVDKVCVLREDTGNADLNLTVICLSEDPSRRRDERVPNDRSNEERDVLQVRVTRRNASGTCPDDDEIPVETPVRRPNTQL